MSKQSKVDWTLAPVGATHAAVTGAWYKTDTKSLQVWNPKVEAWEESVYMLREKGWLSGYCWERATLEETKGRERVRVITEMRQTVAKVLGGSPCMRWADILYDEGYRKGGDV